MAEHSSFMRPCAGLAGIAIACALALGACLDDKALDRQRDPSQWPIALSELQAAQGPSDPGEAAYRRSCIACHGVDGRGADANKQPGKTAADFSAPTGVLTKEDSLLLGSIRNGVKGSIGVMPPHGALLTDSEVTAVLAYVRRSFGPGIAPIPAAAAPDAGQVATPPGP